MFRVFSAHLQEGAIVYMQHMVLSLSTRVRGGLSVHSLSEVQHVTVLNTAGNCNTMVSIIILYYNIMGPPSYMRSVVDRNVVRRRIPVTVFTG